LKALIPPVETNYDLIADALAETGYCILPQLFPLSLTTALHRRVMNLDDDDFKTAGIGREQNFQVNERVRLDETRWLSPQHPVDAEYLSYMAEFRLAINKRLFMGLFDFEAHYAHYSCGAFYKRHVDAFKGESNRVLSTVLYLNQDWQTDHGGELLIYEPGSDNIIETVAPIFGRSIIFLSERFPHEVVKTQQDRYSIAGWFRLQDPLQAPSL